MRAKRNRDGSRRTPSSCKNSRGRSNSRSELRERCRGGSNDSNTPKSLREGSRGGQRTSSPQRVRQWCDLSQPLIGLLETPRLKSGAPSTRCVMLHKRSREVVCTATLTPACLRITAATLPAIREEEETTTVLALILRRTVAMDLQNSMAPKVAASEICCKVPIQSCATSSTNVDSRRRGGESTEETFLMGG